LERLDGTRSALVADMDAIELLKQQHRLVESLFEQLDEAEDGDEKVELVQELADNLAAHTTIEERIFYPTAYGKETKDLLEEAVEEHLAAKRILADLLKMDAKDQNFDAKIKVLKEQIEHHVEEEEGELFPKVRSKLEAGLLESMGTQMEELFEQEMDQQPSADIPGETDRAAPLKPKRGRPQA
jgi:hemerythrin superfamily protein